MNSDHFHCFDFKAMGSPCVLRFYCDDAVLAERAINAAVAEVARLEKKYSRYLPDNFMSEVNAAACHAASINIDAETYSLLGLAGQCYVQSNGLFDITSGVLRRIWLADVSQLPSDRQLSDIKGKIGWQYVQYDKQTMCFLKKGMELDFGGLVKEYAVDRVVYIFREIGLASGLVDLGGDIAVLGSQPDGQPWRVHIKHPRKAGEHIACFELHQGGLASSGDYERYIEIDGMRYCHVFSPKTALPVRGLAAVSVQAERCVLAGCLATMAMLKEGGGAQWLKSLDRPHVWMHIDGEIGGSD